MNLLEDPAQWLREHLHGLLAAAVEHLPALIGGLLVLVAGWVLARIARLLVLRFGRGLDSLLAAVQRRGGRGRPRIRFPLSRALATLAYWLVLLSAVILAADVVGLDKLSAWLLDLTAYLPRVLVAALILASGYLLSAMTRDLVAAVSDSAGFRYGYSLGRAVGGLILVFALLLALSQLGLDITLLLNIVTLAAAAVFGAAGLAFGLGASDSVRNIMAAHYARKRYRPGQRLRVHGLEGEILELTPVSIVLDTAEGSAIIPARLLSEQVAVILDEEEEAGA